MLHEEESTWSIVGIGLQVLESGSYFSPLSRMLLSSPVPPITKRKPSKGQETCWFYGAAVEQLYSLHERMKFPVSWSPTLTSSDHSVAESGDAHWLQLDPGLPVGVVQRTHAARLSSRLPGSVEDENPSLLVPTRLWISFRKRQLKFISNASPVCYETSWIYIFTLFQFKLIAVFTEFLWDRKLPS